MKLVYLMGAGRSGTTLFATILGASKSITTLGEMHWFLEHVLTNKKCSCGNELESCIYWGPIVKKLKKDFSNEELRDIADYNEKVEGHTRIISSLYKKNNKYAHFQEILFREIQETHPSPLYLDSAKFISRGLQLEKIADIDVKFIYLVRDVRGVINSFSKKVQISKSPIGTIMYYSLINFFAQWVQWILGKKKVLKIKYEDFMHGPEDVLEQVERFLATDLTDVKAKLKENDSFNIPHIVGGNRMVSDKKVKIRTDLEWQYNISRPKQLLYYVLTLPFMLLNNYKA